MNIRTALLLALLCIASCGSSDGSGDGRRYLNDLTTLIQRSEQIVFTEHSSGFDAFDEKNETSLVPDEIVYRTRELSPAQKKMFLRTMQNLDPKDQDAFPACVPEIHHTVRFYAGRKLISTMGICFECGQVDWDGTKARVPPQMLYSGLASVVNHIGLESERNWAALARKHLGLPEQAPEHIVRDQ